MSNNATQMIEDLILVVSIGFLVIHGLLQKNFVRDLKSKNWPKTNATIIDGKVSIGGAHGAPAAYGTVSYSYTINDQYYSGYYSKGFSSEGSAWGFVHSVKNDTIIIRYKTSRPEISVL